jgi:hypothetical protein
LTDTYQKHLRPSLNCLIGNESLPKQQTRVNPVKNILKRRN